MRILLFAFLLIPLLGNELVAAADAATSNEQRVRNYVEAYNRHDVDAMMTMVSDEIQWLNVAGDKLSVETRGKEQLRASLVSYFKSMPTAKSSLEWVQMTSSRVAAKEKAIWESKTGEKSQSSLSVYEFKGGLIARVYYYSAEK